MKKLPWRAMVRGPGSGRGACAAAENPQSSKGRRRAAMRAWCVPFPKVEASASGYVRPRSVRILLRLYRSDFAAIAWRGSAKNEIADVHVKLTSRGFRGRGRGSAPERMHCDGDQARDPSYSSPLPLDCSMDTIQSRRYCRPAVEHADVESSPCGRPVFSSCWMSRHRGRGDTRATRWSGPSRTNC